MSTTKTIPKFMKGIVATGYSLKNPESQLSYSDKIPIPSISKGNEVLVRMKYSALNPVDYKIVEGLLKMFVSLTFPAVIGKDGSGVVVKVGKNVKRFKEGDEVTGFRNKGIGSFAQYAVFNDFELSKKPSTMSFEKASSIPLATTTVLQCFDKATQHANKDKYLERVLIIGGSGGTGSFATFVAKHYLKAKNVYSVCSTDNVEYVKSLGADRVIDYKKEDFVKVLNDEKTANNVQGAPLTFVLDCVGGYDNMDKSLSLLDKHGIFTTIAAPEQFEKNPSLIAAAKFGSSLVWRNMKSYVSNNAATHFIMCAHDGERLEKFLTWVENDKDAKDAFYKIKYHEMKLEEAAEAFKLQQSRRVVGKIVLKVDETDVTDETTTTTTSSSTTTTTNETTKE